MLDWSNPVRDNLQHGAVFLWLRDGRPAAIVSIFSHPDDKFPGRRVMHELHALDAEKLVVGLVKGPKMTSAECHKKYG